MSLNTEQLYSEPIDNAFSSVEYNLTKALKDMELLKQEINSVKNNRDSNKNLSNKALDFSLKLNNIKNSLDNAVNNATTLEDFKKEYSKIMVDWNNLGK